jgi:hypothetical protein
MPLLCRGLFYGLKTPSYPLQRQADQVYSYFFTLKNEHLFIKKYFKNIKKLSHYPIKND